eukprot:scaffold68766_cov37-Prasinocladus_malaysianus.AAC.1
MGADYVHVTGCHRYCSSPDLPGLSRQVLQAELTALGPMRRDEYVVAGAQLFQIVFWFGRGLVLQQLVGRCTQAGAGGSRDECLSAGGSWTSPFASYDAGIACAAAVALFVIPSSERPRERILDWEYVNGKMPWDILLLLGGGFAVSTGFLGQQQPKSINFLKCAQACSCKACLEDLAVTLMREYSGAQ